MFSNTLKIPLSVCLLFLLGAFLSLAILSMPPTVEPTPTTALAGKLPEIAGYQKWTRANEQPKLVPSPIATLCAAPTSNQMDREKMNPHNDKYIVVYVNDKGKRAMLEEKTPRFPVGAVIVKEKLSKPDSKTPELLTVMVKRGEGFDRANGDWEYFAVDGAGRKITVQGQQTASCQSCHVGKKAADYVFRNYLPASVWEKLR